MDDKHRMTGPPTGGKRKIVLALILAAPVVGGIFYFIFFWSDAMIYVDNGGKEPITVLMDGDQKLVVGPGEVKSFSCRAGSHRIVAKRGDKVVFDETKTIEGQRYGLRKYLLNPEATNRYRTIEVQYGMNIPRFQTSRDDEDKVRLVVRSLSLVRASDWIDVSPDHVLEPAPKKVSGQVVASRKVLARVPKADADYILTTLARWDKEGKQYPDTREGEYLKVEKAAERIKKAAHWIESRPMSSSPRGMTRAQPRQATAGMGV